MAARADLARRIHRGRAVTKERQKKRKRACGGANETEASLRPEALDRATAFATALARDLDRCAAIHAITARELAGAGTWIDRYP